VNRLGSYTKGTFKKNEKIIAEPTPHPMVVLRFSSNALEHFEQISV